ncbi:hypothetical protein KDK77_10340, partial [bacterium]|nr:hypothetical protein [bacterium]
MYMHLVKKVRESIVFFMVFFCMLLSTPFGNLPVVLAQETPLKEMELLGSRVRHRITSFRYDRVKKETEYNLKVLNLGRDPIYPPIRMVIESISAAGVTLANPDGQMNGKDYVELGAALFENGVFLHAQAVENLIISFNNPSGAKFSFDVSFYGRMELEGTSFAAVGVHPSSAVSSLTLQTLSARLDRSRGGMEYLVRIKNTGDETVYGPIKLFIESVSPPEASFGDEYGEINGKPFIYVEDELPNGKLEPNGQSDSFWLFFDNPTQVKFIYTTSSDGHTPYYLDIGDRVDVQVNEVLTELGVSRFNVQITNLSVQDIVGPVRVRVNSVSVDGVPVAAGDLGGLMQSKSGQTAAGAPFQALLANGVVLAQDGVHTAEMVWGNSSGGDMTFELTVEALYQGLTSFAELSVVVESESHDQGNSTTSQTIKVTNTGSDTIAAPLVVVIQTISDNDAYVASPDGYINGKAFFEIPLANGVLGPSQTTQTIVVNYADAGQAPFTVTFSAQASTLAFVDSEAPVTAHDYQNDGFWVKQDVVVNFSATDNFSGVKETRLKVNSDPVQIANQLTFTASGEFLIEYYSVDNAGNAETPRQILVRIDKIKPVATDNFSANGQWVNSNISISLNASDGHSGVQDIFFKVDSQTAQAGNTVSITAPGEHTVEYWAVDFAGNVGDSTFLVAKLDKNPPQTQDNYDGQPILGNITIALSASDDLSGVAATKYRINNGTIIQGTSIVIAVPGDYIIQYRSEDNAGNIEDWHQLEITVQAVSAPVFFVTTPSNGLTTKQSTVDI